MNAAMSRRSRSMVAVLLAMLGGCPVEPDLPAVREPRCEPRSTTALGRLTLDTRAEHYGTTPPCRLEVSFAIARNSELRALSARLMLENPAGEVSYDDTKTVELHGPSGGMWRAKAGLDSATGPSCRSLALEARVIQCLDNRDREIACPPVRVRESLVLREFDVSGAQVCFDD